MAQLTSPEHEPRGTAELGQTLKPEIGMTAVGGAHSPTGPASTPASVLVALLALAAHALIAVAKKPIRHRFATRISRVRSITEEA
jgi:hypothetical protein